MSKKFNNLISYILPPEDAVFFNLFQEGARICNEAALHYLSMTENGKMEQEFFENARAIKKKATKNFKLTLKQLNRSFITPIEREDIQYIASLLQKITKRITRACLNLQVYRISKVTPEMKDQAKTLVAAADELNLVTQQLKKISDVDSITKSNIRMKELEIHGDDVVRGAIGELFSGKFDAIDVIKYRDIYKEIENALDACYSISDTVLNIVLKQS